MRTALIIAAAFVVWCSVCVFVGRAIEATVAR